MAEDMLEKRHYIIQNNNTTDDEKALIIMPETSRKAVNLSMISGHWYFLICHPQKEGVKQQSTELHKMFEGKQALQSS